MNKSFSSIVGMTALAFCSLLVACGTSDKKDKEFHTSGSQEADQRAEQRISKLQQIRGKSANETDKGTQMTLYERLGGSQGVDAILDDFIKRVIEDPRVNWQRTGVTRGGMLGIGQTEIDWEPTAPNVSRLKRHLSQFVALATGGPAEYQGKNMEAVHAGMSISNVEFDAAVGDLKASMDNVGVPTQEQKELLAIIESTRPQIVEKR